MKEIGRGVNWGCRKVVEIKFYFGYDEFEMLIKYFRGNVK